MILIYIVFFFAAFWFKYKKSGFSTTAFLLLIYFISSIAAGVLLAAFDKYEHTPITLSSVLYNLICLTLFFSPLIAYDDFDIRNVKFPKKKVMVNFAWLIIILCLCSITNSFANAIKVFSYSNLAQARIQANSGELIEENRIFLITYLGGYGAQLSLYALILYFYFKKFIPNSRLIQILLFISSFQIILVNLVGVGRDGAIRWILFFVFCLSLFRSVIKPHEYKKIVLKSIIAFSPFIFILIAISASRAKFNDENTFLFLIDYIGQPFINFSRFFSELQSPSFFGRLNFSFFFPSSEAVSIRHLWIKNTTGDLNVFPTFVGSFLMDFGAFLLLLLAIIYFLIAKLVFRRVHVHFSSKRRIGFVKLIIYCWLVQVFLLGVFYYMFSNPTSIRVFFILIIIGYSMQHGFKAKFGSRDYRFRLNKFIS